MTMKKYMIFIFAVVLGMLFNACEYEFIEVQEATGGGEPTGTETVSFSNDVLPIFTNYCISCHKTGGQAPDLTADNAYNSLFNGGYVVISSPNDSKIYTYPNPTTSTHSRKKYTAAQAELIYTWIDEGATKN